MITNEIRQPNTIPKLKQIKSQPQTYHDYEWNKLAIDNLTCILLMLNPNHDDEWN